MEHYTALVQTAKIIASSLAASRYCLPGAAIKFRNEDKLKNKTVNCHVSGDRISRHTNTAGRHTAGYVWLLQMVAHISPALNTD